MPKKDYGLEDNARYDNLMGLFDQQYQEDLPPLQRTAMDDWADEKDNPMVGDNIPVPVLAEPGDFEEDYLPGELALGPFDMPIDAWDNFKTGRRTDNVLRRS